MATEADLIDALYESVLKPDGFSAALELACKSLDAHGGNVRLHDPATGSLQFAAVAGPYHDNPEVFAAYIAEWRHQDVHLLEALRRGADGSIVMDADVITPEMAANNAYLNEFLWPLGCTALMGSLHRVSNQMCAIGFVREAGAESFGETERRALMRLQPHIERSTWLAQRSSLAALQHATDVNAALEAHRTLILRCDREGRIVYATASAERMLADCLAVRLGSGGLIWRETRDREAFARLCLDATERVASAESTGVLVVRDGERDWLRIVGMPAPRAPNEALVMMRRVSGDGRGAIPTMKRLFGLTRAEARLAAAISEGASLNELEGRFGVTRATLRTQLRSVFEKVGVHRQSELAALAARLS